MTDFAKSVNSIVPRGFATYVRVFHPAYRTPEETVSWAEIAAANGRIAHAGMQLNALTGRDQYNNQPGVFEAAPDVGSLPGRLLPPLLEALSRHTATPDRCWFAVWEGWGDLRPEFRYQETFGTPGRTYVLLHGPLECALEPVTSFDQSASIWWPDDRAWCVATEVDFVTTYVGCSEACRDDLLARHELEAYQIDQSYGITGASDLMNSEIR